VLLQLDPGIRDMVDLDLHAELAAGVANLLGQLGDVENLGELIENAVLPGRGGVRRCQLDTLERVDDVEEPPRLTALPIHGQRMADHRLHRKAVQRRPEELVVVEPGRQTLVEPRLGRLDPIYDALVQIGGTQTPDTAGEMDVVAVMDLGKVVERSRKLGEGKGVAPALVLDLDEALFDVDVRRPILAHRSELDQMSVGRLLTHGPEQLQRADDVVRLGDDRVIDVLHRPRRARLLAVVDDHAGLEVAKDFPDESSLSDVSDVGVDPVARYVAPGFDPLLERPDRSQGVRSRLFDPSAAGEIVDDCDVVPSAGKAHGRGPAEVAVAAENQYSHRRTRFI
jgi:hypothetical protein